MVLLLAHFLMRECGLAVQKGREEEPDLPRFAEYRGSWLTVSQILSTVCPLILMLTRPETRLAVMLTLLQIEGLGRGRFCCAT